jgi:hypothetical protein
MRTNIVIDDNLMLDVLHVTGLKTKREAVEFEASKPCIIHYSKQLIIQTKDLIHVHFTRSSSPRFG